MWFQSKSRIKQAKIQAASEAAEDAAEKREQSMRRLERALSKISIKPKEMKID